MNHMMVLSRSTACWWVSLKYFSNSFLRVPLMRSKAQFLCLALRYLRQLSMHSQRGYFSSMLRYSLMSQIQLNSLLKMSSHRKNRLIFSNPPSIHLVFSCLQNSYRSSPVASKSQSHSHSQNAQLHFFPSFSFISSDRLCVSQLRKSRVSVSPGAMRLSANTASPPLTWRQVQLARQLCLKPQSSDQTPMNSSFPDTGAYTIFYRYRHRRHLEWISFTSIPSGLLRLNRSTWPWNSHWLGSCPNDCRNRSSYPQYTFIWAISEVQSSPNLSCSSFWQMSGLLKSTISKGLMRSPATKLLLPVWEGLSCSSLSLVEKYSPKVRGPPAKSSFQSNSPWWCRWWRQQVACARQNSGRQQLSLSAISTDGTSLNSRSYSRHANFLQIPFTYCRSIVTDAYAQAKADLQSRSSKRHWEELAQRMARSLRFSGLCVTPSPNSYSASACRQFFSRNLPFAPALIFSGSQLLNLMQDSTWMFYSRVTNSGVVEWGLQRYMFWQQPVTFSLVRKECWLLQANAASLCSKTTAIMPKRSSKEGKLSSAVRQRRTWLYWRVRTRRTVAELGAMGALRWVRGSGWQQARGGGQEWMGTFSWAKSRYWACWWVMSSQCWAWRKRAAPRQVWIRGSRSCSLSRLVLAMMIKFVLQTTLRLKFIMALLQQQMTRYHEDTRPRFANPTYASTNVGSTLGMYAPFIYRNISNRYNVDLQPASRERSNRGQIQGLPRRSVSQLSNIGSNSLKSLNRYISDKEVFEKQQKNYNIISVQPREYQDTIKYFPKYRLENEDQNYFRKMQLERDFANKLIANKETIKRTGTINPETSAIKPIRGKYLNNVDEVADMI